MTNKEAIELLSSMKSEPVDYGELVGAPTPYLGIHYVHIEPEDYAIDLAIKALEQQEKDRWIPVSDETNPTKNDVYMVTFEEQGKRYVERFYFSSFSGWLMPVCWKDEGYIEKLIAWKPMSEPCDTDEF